MAGPQSTLNISIDSVTKSGTNYSVVFNTGANPTKITATGANPGAILADLRKKIDAESLPVPPNLDSLKPQIQKKIEELSGPVGQKALPKVTVQVPPAEVVPPIREKRKIDTRASVPLRESEAVVRLSQQFGILDFTKGQMPVFYERMGLNDGPVTAETNDEQKFKAIKLLYGQLLRTEPFDMLVACGLNYKPDMDAKDYDEKAVRIMQEFLKRSFLKDEPAAAAAKRVGVDVAKLTEVGGTDVSGQFTYGTARALSYYFYIINGSQGTFKSRSVYF